MFYLISRDGVKYGIYFAVTAVSTNAVRYKTQQNFKTLMTMQLNDPSDYPIIVGKTDGLVPSKCKGRGLIAMDKVYEFQTAYCSSNDDTQEFIRTYCAELAETATVFAKPIPVLPDAVTLDYVRSYVEELQKLPIGVSKKSLNVVTTNIKNKVVYPVFSQEVHETVAFVEEFAKLTALSTTTVIVDAEQSTDASKCGCKVVDSNFESFVQEVFADMATRNNTYKDAKMDPASLEKFEEKVYMIIGLKRFVEQLTDDGKEKLSILLAKAESFYKLHFVIAEAVSSISSFSYEEWYKRHVNGSEGLWVGDGVADQYTLKISKVTNELYEEIGNEYGYSVVRNKPTLIKLLSSNVNEEVE